MKCFMHECSVMNLPVIQIVKFNNYINGNSMFGTHQGVKGLEFDRVLVIIDEKRIKYASL